MSPPPYPPPSPPFTLVFDMVWPILSPVWGVVFVSTAIVTNGSDGETAWQSGAWYSASQSEGIFVPNTYHKSGGGWSLFREEKQNKRNSKFKMLLNTTTEDTIIMTKKVHYMN